MILRTFISCLFLGVFLTSAENQNLAQWNTSQYDIPDTVKMLNRIIGLSNTPSSLIDKPDSAEYVLVYPNPSPGHLFVDFHFMEEKNIYISIYDESSRIVLEAFKPGTLNQKYRLDLEDLPTGNYFIRISSETKKMVVRFSIYK